jgi:hypothetical protein
MSRILIDCTAAQRAAVMSVTPDGSQYASMLEECAFQRACIKRKATGRLATLLSGWSAKSQEFEDVHTFFRFFDSSRFDRSRGGGGLYVELGALDGVYKSNSFFYQQVLGWHGVLVEAALQNFMLLTRNVESGLRHNVSTVHAAACPLPAVLRLPLPTDYFNESHSPWNARKNRNAMTRASADTGGTDTQAHRPKVSAPVLCVSMRTILEGAPITAHARGIDFYSIDVEGHELNVVASHDWQRLPAKVVLIELNRKINPEEHGQIRTVLAEQGGLCRFGRSGHSNELWVDPMYDSKVALGS